MSSSHSRGDPHRFPLPLVLHASFRDVELVEQWVRFIAIIASEFNARTYLLTFAPLLPLIADLTTRQVKFSTIKLYGLEVLQKLSTR